MLVKAMVLASTVYQQRSGVSSAASFLLEGQSVDLSQELLEQKVDFARKQEWEFASSMEDQTRPTLGKVRVCWQCPEASSALHSKR